MRDYLLVLFFNFALHWVCNNLGFYRNWNFLLTINPRTGFFQVLIPCVNFSLVFSPTLPHPPPPSLFGSVPKTSHLKSGTERCIFPFLERSMPFGKTFIAVFIKRTKS